MTYRGHIKNGVVVLDSSVSLPEGLKVEVCSVGEDESIPTLYDRLKDMIGIAEGLPADSSINHNHYLYGVTKK